MIEAQHTPGPWTTDDAGSCWNIDGGGRSIGEVYKAHASGIATDTDGDEAESNARLIAAAPELLRVLLLVADVLENGRDPSEICEHANAVTRAIVKSAGR